MFPQRNLTVIDQFNVLNYKGTNLLLASAQKGNVVDINATSTDIEGSLTIGDRSIKINGDLNSTGINSIIFYGTGGLVNGFIYEPSLSQYALLQTQV